MVSQLNNSVNERTSSSCPSSCGHDRHNRYDSDGGHSNRRSKFRTFSPSQPCPLCQADHACAVNEAGIHHCHHCTGEEIAGWVFLGLSSIGFGKYRRDDDDSCLLPRYDIPRVQPEQGPAPSFLEWCQRTADRRRALVGTSSPARAWAGELGLPDPRVFESLGVQWLESDENNRGDLLCVPEKNGQGEVIGYSRRYRDGNKYAVGNRGITLPRGLTPQSYIHDASSGDTPGGSYPGPIYLVEGASDVLTLLTMGRNVIGRPSNTGGGAFLVEFLRSLPREWLDVVVVGENDRKSDGRWPGREGAYRLAKQIADELNLRVRIVFPPDGAKDARDFFKRECVKARRHRALDAAKYAAMSWDQLLASADVQRPGDPLRYQHRVSAETSRAVVITSILSVGLDRKPDDLSDLSGSRIGKTWKRTEHPGEGDTLPDLGGERVGAAIAKARERGKLAEDRAEEATAKLVCDALLAAAKRCPNPGPPLHLKKPGKRAVMRRACEKPDCPVCREYLKTRALAVLSHHIHAAEARGEHLYLSQVDTDAAWRPAYYRMRRKGLTDYAVLRDRDADGRPCMTCIATGPPDAALGIRVSARQAIGQIRAAVEAWRGEADLIIHKSDSWPVSIYDRPGEWECLGYAGTHDRKMLLDIAETVAATVSVGDPLEMPHIAQWTGIELPESASTEDGAYLDYQLAVGKVVPRAMWEQSCRAPHYGEESPLPSPQSGAPSASPCAELGYGSGITPWG